MLPEKADLEVGDVAPDFSMPSTRKHDFTLSMEVKKGPVLLYFYPKDYGIVCGKYMQEMIGFLPQLSALGVTIVHINPDSMQSHMDWVRDTGSPFEHITDIDQHISKEYGAIITNEKAPKVLGCTNRELFLVDKGMVIRYVWRTDLPADTMPIPILLDDLRTAPHEPRASTDV